MIGMDTDLSEKSRTSARFTAFVDVSVIAAYLTGGDAVLQVFDDGYRRRVRFAADPVVLQEVLTLPQIRESPQLLETVVDRLNCEILPLDIGRSQQLLGWAKALHNRLVHSSGVLVPASAGDCDYLITYDRGLKELIEGDRPRVVTPEQFTSLMVTPFSRGGQAHQVLRQRWRTERPLTPMLEWARETLNGGFQRILNSHGRHRP